MEYKYTLLWATLISCQLVYGNQYDPHLMPSTGPFFEGWYIRFLDQSKNRSFGVLLGSVVPANQSAANNLAFVGLLHSSNQSGQLEDYSAFTSPDDVTVTVKDGLPVTRNPDRRSPADFTWAYPNGFIRVQPEGAIVNITVGTVSFWAQIAAPVPWAPDGEGPMANWDDYMSFPLYWFVYSLRSPIIRYVWSDETGQLVGDAGVAHMEKNWGDSFPAGWIWSQGYSTSTNATFALTYGPIKVLGVIDLSGFLVGYRDEDKNINLNFRPDNSHVTRDFDGCSGNASFIFTSLTFSNKLELTLVSSPGNYSDCLYGPMENGFRPVCKETFVAIATVKIYKRHIFSWSLIDQQTIHGAALEFGGKFTCNDECKAN